MVHSSSVRFIKSAQKKSLFLQAISKHLRMLSQDDARLQDISATRVKLAADLSSCIVFLYTARGEDYFKEALEVLKLYGPSMRKMLASELNQRRTPTVRFVFDDRFEKEMHVEQLFEKIKSEDPQDQE
jgi:ribosome-binding factor A